MWFIYQLFGFEEAEDGRDRRHRESFTRVFFVLSVGFGEDGGVGSSSRRTLFVWKTLFGIGNRNTDRFVDWLFVGRPFGLVEAACNCYCWSCLADCNPPAWVPQVNCLKSSTKSTIEPEARR